MKRMQDKYKLSPGLVFFVLYISIVDTGILSYQKVLSAKAGYAAWLSALITGISIHLLIWMIYILLRSMKLPAGSPDPIRDLVTVNRICFGAFFGKIPDILATLYFFTGAFILFRSFLTVVQVWLFPVMPLWPVALMIIILLYYTITGGIRSVTGLSFWGMLTSLLCILPLLFLALPYLHPGNLTPLMSAEPKHYMEAARKMVPQYLGIEALLMLYPLIHKPEKSHKWAHFSSAAATALYLVLLLVTYMVYNLDQLKMLVWPTLHIYKVVQFPVFQRIEYLIVSALLVSVSAKTALGLWMACRTGKRSLRINQHYSLLVGLGLFLLGTILIKDYDTIIQVTRFYNTAGFWFLFGYIPLIFAITLLKRALYTNKSKTS